MSEESDETECGERLPALVDVERMKAYCRKVGWLDAPIFSPPEDFSHPTDRMAATWLMMGYRLGLAARPKPPVPRAKGRPRKVRPRGGLSSLSRLKDFDEVRASIVELVNQLYGDHKTDAEIVRELKGGGRSSDIFTEFSLKDAKRLFTHAETTSLRNSVSRGKRKLRSAKPTRPSK